MCQCMSTALRRATRCQPHTSEAGRPPPICSVVRMWCSDSEGVAAAMAALKQCGAMREVGGWTLSAVVPRARWNCSDHPFSPPPPLGVRDPPQRGGEGVAEGVVFVGNCTLGGVVLDSTCSRQ